MADKNYLSRISSVFPDYTLNVPADITAGDVVLILGTSSRGPINTPLAVDNITTGEAIYGNDEGTLLRGYRQVVAAARGEANVRLCRIDGGDKSKIVFYENLSSGVSDESRESYPSGDLEVALTLTAYDPGSDWDGLLVERGSYTGYTGEQFKFSHPLIIDSNGDVSPVYIPVADSVSTMAQKLNESPIGAYYLVESSIFSTSFELDTNDFYASGLAAYGAEQTEAIYNTIITDNGASFDIDMSELITSSGVVTGSPSGVSIASYLSDYMELPTTGGNRLYELTEIYENTDVEDVDVDAVGKSQVSLTNGIQSGESITSMRHVFTDSYIGTGDGTTTLFSFTAYEPIDTVETIVVKRTSPAGTTVTVSASDYTITSVGGEDNNLEASIEFDEAIALGTIVVISYVSEAMTLSKSSTLDGAKTSGSYKTYYFAGRKLTFGAAQPADIRLDYPAKIVYRIGDECQIVTDDNPVLGNHVISIGTADKLPNLAFPTAPGEGTVIGFSYTYLPEAIDVDSKEVETLGTSDIDLINRHSTEDYNAIKKDTLEETFSEIANYPADIVVLMNTHIDDNIIDSDDETGADILVNAGFAEMFIDYLTQLQDGVSEAIGIMSVKPMDTTLGTFISKTNIDAYYEDLATLSFLEPTIAANVMAGINDKLLQVTAFEPKVGAESYTGEAFYAGIISWLPYQDNTTFKPIDGANTLRFQFDPTQINTLVGKRYVVAKLQGATPVIVDGITAAAPGSDYTRLSTLRIAFGAMKLVRQVAQPYLGNGFNAVKKTALDTAINVALGKLVPTALKNYSYKLTQTKAQEVVGHADVTLVLNPVHELRTIKVTVSLTI